MEDLDIVEANADHALGSWRGAVLYVWRGITTEGAAKELERIGRAVRGRGEAVGVFLGAVEPGTPAPDADARKALAAFLHGGGGHVRASALAFEGEGFQASMVRAVATGLALLARVPFPHRVFAGVPDATEWLEERVRALGLAPYPAAVLAEKLHALRTAPHCARRVR